MEHQKAILSLERRSIAIQTSGITLWNRALKDTANRPLRNAPKPIGAAAFTLLARQSSVSVFKASMADIEKALNPKPKGDPGSYSRRSIGSI